MVEKGVELLKAEMSVLNKRFKNSVCVNECVQGDCIECVNAVMFTLCFHFLDEVQFF